MAARVSESLGSLIRSRKKKSSARIAGPRCARPQPLGRSPGRRHSWNRLTRRGILFDQTVARRRRIRDADEVIVICGEHTQDSPRMDAELRVTQEEEKPYFLLWGRREQMCTMPAHVPRNECMYSWTFESLLELVRTTIRKAEPLQVLEHEKRP